MRVVGTDIVVVDIEMPRDLRYYNSIPVVVVYAISRMVASWDTVGIAKCDWNDRMTSSIHELCFVVYHFYLDDSFHFPLLNVAGAFGIFAFESAVATGNGAEERLPCTYLLQQLYSSPSSSSSARQSERSKVIFRISTSLPHGLATDGLFAVQCFLRPLLLQAQQGTRL